MTRPDRLSALTTRFSLAVSTAHEGDANFWIMARDPDGPPCAVCIGRQPIDYCPLSGASAVLAHAQITWGGADTPLFWALPDHLSQPLDNDPDLQALAQLFLSELRANRCGAAAVLSRLGEVLVVRLLRAQIQSGAVESGVLAALADPRLSRAMVAMHDQPDHPWRLDHLAQEAGLSPSRFSELFGQTVGMTPLAYLRQWRLVLARQDIERGDRIQRVAQRYCYGSPEALSRAVTSAYGQTPMELRKSARQTSPHLEHDRIA